MAKNTVVIEAKEARRHDEKHENIVGKNKEKLQENLK